MNLKSVNMKLIVKGAITASRCLSVLLLLMSCAAVQAKTAGVVEVSNLEVLRAGDDTRVEVTLTAPVRPLIEIATEPDRLVLILPNTVSSAQQRRIGVNHNGVRRVRMGLNSANPPVTRVVVEMDRQLPYAVSTENNKIILRVRPGLTSASATASRSGLANARLTASAQARAPVGSQQASPDGASNPVASLTPPTVGAPAENRPGTSTASASTLNSQPAGVAISSATDLESKTAEAPIQPTAAGFAASPPVAKQPDPETAPSSAALLTATPSETPHVGSPIPAVSGFMAFQSSFAPGEQHINPVFDPILLVPLGNRLLVESEFEMNLDAVRGDGKWGPAIVDHSIEYLQLNYIAHPNLTITAGRFLTPFGIYRERVHPLWVRNLQDEPIIFAMNANSSNGAMLRGDVRLSSGMNLTYSNYYSFPTSRKLVTSERRMGTRTSLVLPNKRIEVGASFSRNLGDLRYNMFGLDFTWNLKMIPLDIRAEGLRNAMLGNGYWVEGAYRLRKLGINPFLGKSQVVLRGEQYFAPRTAPMSDMAANMMSGLPDRGTKRLGIGWNYYLTNGIRLNASFGRNFATGENRNAWGAGITYRFAIF